MNATKRDPLFVVLLLVATVSATAAALPVLPAALIGGVQTMLAVMSLRQREQGEEG